MIERMKSINVRRSGEMVAVWDDPDLEETISHLEWAYQHRDELNSFALQAGNDLKQFSWKQCAENFNKVILSHN